jgi:hypothetical protein
MAKKKHSFRKKAHHILGRMGGWGTAIVAVFLYRMLRRVMKQLPFFQSAPDSTGKKSFQLDELTTAVLTYVIAVKVINVPGIDLAIQPLIANAVLETMGLLQGYDGGVGEYLEASPVSGPELLGYMMSKMNDDQLIGLENMITGYNDSVMGADQGYQTMQGQY